MQRSRSLLLTLFVALCLVGQLQPASAAIVATGDVDPDPATTPWTFSTTGYVGKTAEGTLTVDAESVLHSEDAYIGYEDTATGEVTVDGAGSTWASDGRLCVGYEGSGTLRISGGAAVAVDGPYYVYIADESGSTGTVTVDGAESTWSNGDRLFVGGSGSGMLRITGGGAVSNDRHGDLGYTSGSTGEVTIEGAGSTWTTGERLRVGRAGSGTLSITDGGLVTVGGPTYVASEAGSTGTVTVDGTGSAWSIGEALSVGGSGSGMLTITGGGTVSNDGGGGIGSSSGSTGEVTVEGAGSTWTIGGALRVAGGGSGILTINDGGVVLVGGATDVVSEAGTIHFGTGGGALTTQSLYASPTQLLGTGTINTHGLMRDFDFDFVFDSTHGSINTFTLDGEPGQQITLNVDLGDSSYAGSLAVGWGGNGSLTVSDGVTVNSDDGYIGYESGSTGVATVSGAGSTWTNDGALEIGHYGSGTLDITDGALVTNGHGSVGARGDSTGAVTVSGAGSTWTNSGSVYVGTQGSGTLNIIEGAAVSGLAGNIARQSGSTGVVTVSGADSTWTNSLNLTVGGGGSGTLNIADGAAVSGAIGYVAHGSSSTGVVTVSGAGSTWTNDDALYVGYNGSGTLNITDGALVTNADGDIGSLVDSTGVVTVNGAGSTWTNSGDLVVGVGGSGTLSITGGGTVSNTSGEIGSTGVVTVDGPGSTWANSGNLTVNGHNGGTLNISGGGAVSNSYTRIGYSSGRTGMVSVDGPGSKLTIDDYISVGGEGSGTLSITGGGAVSNSDGYIGRESGSTGQVTVDGAGSTWTSREVLYVGDEGSGALSITGGGAVSSAFGYLGWRSDSAGVATVDGSGSNWANSGDLVVGVGGSGTLSITGRATVSNRDSFIGGNSISTAVVTVDGSGSAWTATGSLYVGVQGRGTLNITGGAAVSSTYGCIGREFGSTGVVSVNGPGSTWTSSHDLSVGRVGSATLSINDGGCVLAGRDASVGFQGVLEIGLGRTQRDALGTVPDKLGVGEDPPLAVGGDVTLFVLSTLRVFAGGRLTGTEGETVCGDLTETLITAGGSAGVVGTFPNTPQVGDYYGTPPTQGEYLGHGVWFGNNKTGEGVIYVGAPGVVTGVDVAVFQAKAGDCDGDRTVGFADFNDLANNYTGALDPGVGEKEWRQGDFDGDADVDFGDFNDLANGYTGAGVEYGPGKAVTGDAKAAPGGGGGLFAPEVARADEPPMAPEPPMPPNLQGEAELIVYLADAEGVDGVFHSAGDVVLSVDGGLGESGMRLNGYEVYSAGGLLVPDLSGVAYPLVGGVYMEEASTGIVAMGGLTRPLWVSGRKDWTLGWGYDVAGGGSGRKGARDLEFRYGTGEGVISGSVLYVVPEPGTLLLLVCGVLGLLFGRARGGLRCSR